MIRINLIPLRASRRKDDAKKELAVMGASLGVVLVGLVAWHSANANKISDLEAQIDAVQNKISGIKKDVVRVKDFRKQAKELQRKLDAIEKLKKKKLGPAKFMEDLATILTEERRVWLTSLVEENGELTLTGGAIEHQDISNFTMALQQDSAFFSQISLAGVQSAKKSGVQYLKWTIACRVNYGAG
mgnify:CR=1 FL=1